jgi:hypothetical protein
MRRYVAAFIALLAVIILLGIWLYRPAEKKTAPPQIHPPQDKPVAAAPATPSPGPVKKQMPGGPFEPSDPRWAEVQVKDQIDKGWEWKMPINFYGKVVDQDDHPVSSARIKFSWTDLSNNGSSQSETSSDAQGNFTLENQKGRVLLVTVAKPGYYTAKQENQDAFDYAGFWEKTYYQPDSQKPVTFHLRKKGATENLLAGRLETRVPSGGAETPIALSRNQADSWARLEVKAWTNTDKYPPRQFDWRVILAVPGGEIQPCNDEFPFTAPENNYTPSIDVNMPSAAENWKHGIDQQFYIRYTNPVRYGRIRFQMDGASQNVSVAYWLNPASGSRNLEFDATKQVKSP